MEWSGLEASTLPSIFCCAKGMKKRRELWPFFDVAAQCMDIFTPEILTQESEQCTIMFNF